MILRPCYAFDLDRTLFDNSHRVHFITQKPKRYREYHEAAAWDDTIAYMVELAKILGRAAPLIYVTARNEVSRHGTVQAFKENDLPLRDDGAFLYMRASEDRRPNVEVKVDLIAQAREDGWVPIMAFDDEPDSWIRSGIPCCKVMGEEEP